MFLGAAFAATASFCMYKYIRYVVLERRAATVLEPRVKRERLADILAEVESRTQLLVKTNEAALGKQPAPAHAAAAADVLRYDVATMQQQVYSKFDVTASDVDESMRVYAFDAATADPVVKAQAGRIRRLLAPHMLTKASAMTAFRAMADAQVDAVPDVVRAAVDAFGSPHNARFQPFVSEAMQSVAAEAVQGITGFSSLAELQTAVATRYARDAALAASASALLQEGMEAVNGGINRMLQQMMMTGELQM